MTMSVTRPKDNNAAGGSFSAAAAANARESDAFSNAIRYCHLNKP